MKWELDDNARSGFHYLLLGVVVVGTLVLLNWLLDRSFPGIGPLGAFSHGYLVADDGINLISAGTSREERIATAALLAFGSALAVGGALAGGAALFGQRNKKFVLGSAWSVFVLVLSWFGYSALRLPPGEFLGKRGEMCMLAHRSVLINDLTLPWSERVEEIPVTRIDSAGSPTIIGTVYDHIEIALFLEDGSSKKIGEARDYCLDKIAIAPFARSRVAALNGLLGPR